MIYSLNTDISTATLKFELQNRILEAKTMSGLLAKATIEGPAARNVPIYTEALDRKLHEVVELYTELDRRTSYIDSTAQISP